MSKKIDLCETCIYNTNDFACHPHCSGCDGKSKHVQIKTYTAEERKQKWDALSTESHSERDIYNGCVRLMRSVYNRMLEVLELAGFDYEEDIALEFTPQEIVKMLFLSNTNHSGGTSTLKKCSELGIDTDDVVIFEPEREDDQ